jgi:serine/threonine-protein kinase
MPPPSSDPEPDEPPIAMGEGARPEWSEEAPAHRVGEILADKYRLEGLLGQGGMGTVWRARSLVLDVDVAIKVVPRDATSQEAGDRLLREARAAASLGHPAIVRVFDFGTTRQGEPFLVMELLEGKSLGTLLDELGRYPATVAVRLLLPVIAALASAHARGIVHRDIKPDNIVVLPPEGDADLGAPKLVDFGIAKLSAAHTTSLTQKGTLLGSPAYMSPEQARGLEAVDAQTDVWAVCVVLYELITGRRPFEGPNGGAVIFAIYAEAPRPTTAHAAGDPELWEIIRRGLEKRAADRWPGARALGRELAAWALERGVTTDAAGSGIREQWLGRGSLPEVAPLSASSPLWRRSSAGISTEAGTTASVLPNPVDEAPGARASQPGPEAIAGLPRRWRRAPGFVLAGGLALVAAAIAGAALRGSAGSRPAPASVPSPIAAAAPTAAAPGATEIAPTVTPAQPLSPSASASAAAPAAPRGGASGRPPPGHEPPPARSPTAPPAPKDGSRGALPPPDF